MFSLGRKLPVPNDLVPDWTNGLTEPASTMASAPFRFACLARVDNGIALHREGEESSEERWTCARLPLEANEYLSVSRGCGHFATAARLASVPAVQ